jgi:hypothetical protein
LLCHVEPPGREEGLCESLHNDMPLSAGRQFRWGEIQRLTAKDAKDAKGKTGERQHR